MDIEREVQNVHGEMESIRKAVTREARETDTPAEVIADHVANVPGWPRERITQYVVNIRQAKTLRAELRKNGLEHHIAASAEGGILGDQRVTMSVAADPSEFDTSGLPDRIEAVARAAGFVATRDWSGTEEVWTVISA